MPEVSESENPFKLLAREFKVSSIVAARRAQDLGFINRRQFLDFYESHKEQTSETSDKKAQRGNFYNNQETRVGRRFGETVVRAVREGALSYKDAFRLTDLNRKTFDGFVDHLKDRDIL